MIISKLAYRNMKRSARDYLVYLFTMIMMTALMFAFNSLIFQNGVGGYFDLDGLMQIMIGFATFFIVMIMAWLINYMVCFMLEKRSREFGIYLLLGMKRREIAGLYMRENLLLGGIAFLAGLLLGMLIRQLLIAVVSAIVWMEYRPSILVDYRTLLLTLLCYGGCYLLALFRCIWRFKKLNIHDLMSTDRKNEKMGESMEGVKRVFLPLSILFILYFQRLFSAISGKEGMLLSLAGLVLMNYLFYVGLSAWIICYIRKKRAGIYKGQNLFVLRWLASKMGATQFTMGIVTSLFTIALMAASVALMLCEVGNKLTTQKSPLEQHMNGSALNYLLASLTIPMFYIGLVFICAGTTVLAVHQLSDSVRHKSEYDVLTKLGIKQEQVRLLIAKQLALYQLCPALLSIIISGKMLLPVGKTVVEQWELEVSPYSFFIRNVLLFFAVYLVYAVVTYIGFVRNIERER